MCSHVYPQNLAQCGAYSRCSINAVAQPSTVLHCSHHLCCREAMLQLLNDKVCCPGREWCPVHRTTAQGGWSQRPWVLSLCGVTACSGALWSPGQRLPCQQTRPPTLFSVASAISAESADLVSSQAHRGGSVILLKAPPFP